MRQFKIDLAHDRTIQPGEPQAEMHTIRLSTGRRIECVTAHLFSKHWILQDPLLDDLTIELFVDENSALAVLSARDGAHIINKFGASLILNPRAVQFPELCFLNVTPFSLGFLILMESGVIALDTEGEMLWRASLTLNELFQQEADGILLFANLQDDYSLTLSSLDGREIMARGQL